MLNGESPLSLSPSPPETGGRKGSEAHQKQAAVKERGIDKLLDDAREDQKENDAAYMNRK